MSSAAFPQFDQIKFDQLRASIIREQSGTITINHTHGSGISALLSIEKTHALQTLIAQLEIDLAVFRTVPDDSPVFSFAELAIHKDEELLESARRVLHAREKNQRCC